MFTSIAAASSLMLSSLILDTISQPRQELFTELICWIIILVAGRLRLQYFSKASRPFSFNTTGLSVIAFGATLICLSSSIQKTTWYAAPLLSPFLVILGKDGGLLLPQHGKSVIKHQIASTGRNSIIFLCVFAAVTTTALSQADISYRGSLQLCWLFAQIVLYWGLFDTIPESNSSTQDDFAEAFQTLTELAHLMVMVAAPLTLLWWNDVPVTPQIGLIGSLKAIRWITIFILRHESKLSIPVWTTILSVCTHSNWSLPQGWSAPVTTIGALVSLYHIGITFPQSSYGRYTIFIFALIPIWAFGTQQTGLAFPSEAHFQSSSPPSSSPSIPLTQTPTSTTQHPISLIVQEANQRFKTIQSRQSTSLSQAIAEYKRRYSRSPPPGFDKWYAFAVANDVQFIDEYDYMTHSLDAYWKVEPKVLRDYVDQALAIDPDALNCLTVKEGNATLVNPGFQHLQLLKLIEPIVQQLPDFKAILNGNDEPKVLIPHDKAEIPASKSLEKSGPTSQIQPIYFGAQDQQKTWETVTLPCSPDSLARSALSPKLDNPWPPFISNLTTAQDLCNHPSTLSTKHGFISSPSTFHFTHSPVPVFATAKFSTYSDIMLPSSYYFQSDIAEYNETNDTPWAEKKDQVYWRGSGTGGQWDKGSWKMGHRQRFVNYTNSADGEITLLKKESSSSWTPYLTKLSQVKSLFVVSFSNFIQCSSDDCAAQETHFPKAKWDSNSDSASYKIVYNLDGNSFSGRYYRLLKSNSLVFMQAMFKEWHDDRLIPWVHYVPISIGMEELPETTRWLLEDEEGKKVAEAIAGQGREWSRKVVREVDLTAAYFRVFLEYVRVVSDEREKLS